MFLLEAYFACHACNNFSFFISYHSSETSGDCLYSSASIVLVGDNTLVEELRAMTCIELFLNAEYYSKHPIFSQVFDKHSNLFSSIETLLKISVSDASFNTGLLADNLVKHEAIHNCRQGGRGSIQKRTLPNKIDLFPDSKSVQGEGGGQITS